MQKPKENIFNGKWKSYKIFKTSGDVRFHTQQRFKEFEFQYDGILIITSYEGNFKRELVRTNQWSIEEKKHRHYLNISKPKFIYEVVSIDCELMVLADISFNEKTFYAKEGAWMKYLNQSRVGL